MPPELALFVSLYTDVENASILKQQLLAGNAEFEYAFIDANMVKTSPDPSSYLSFPSSADRPIGVAVVLTSLPHRSSQRPIFSLQPSAP